MNICFFQTQPSEEKFFKEKLMDHNCTFFPDPIHSIDSKLYSDADILCVRFLSKITKEVLEKCTSLKAIVSRTMGLDHIDVQECKKRNITVGYVPKYGDTTVAEHVLSMMLGLARQSKKIYNNPDYTIPQKHDNFFELNGKTLGVIGSGAIGQKVIRLAKAFGMNCIAYDVYQNEQVAKEIGFTYVSLETLLATAEVITLHTPYLSSTHHLINKDSLDKMKKGVVIINAARGGLIDSAALLEKLNTGTVRAAGLDVVECEENLAGSVVQDVERFEIVKKLVAHPNVIFTPHIACYSEQAQIRIIEMTVENIVSFTLTGKTKWTA